MPTPGVPTPQSNVLTYLQQAATGTGLPLPVVEAQNYAESAYGTNEGPSSAGAEGPWQFLPSTFTSLGFPAGQETSWPVSTAAYIKYMTQLLNLEGGSIYKALEAYNAGPGNLSAGSGYASGILSNAGVSQSAQAGAPGSTTPGSVTSNSGGCQVPGLSSVVNPGAWASYITCMLTQTLESIPKTIGDSVLTAFGLKSAKDFYIRLGLLILGGVVLYVGISKAFSINPAAIATEAVGGATAIVGAATLQPEIAGAGAGVASEGHQKEQQTKERAQQRRVAIEEQS